jgi:hypothetical protein
LCSTCGMTATSATASLTRFNPSPAPTAPSPAPHTPSSAPHNPTAAPHLSNKDGNNKRGGGKKKGGIQAASTSTTGLVIIFAMVAVLVGCGVLIRHGSWNRDLMNDDDELEDQFAVKGKRSQTLDVVPPQKQQHSPSPSPSSNTSSRAFKTQGSLHNPIPDLKRSSSSFQQSDDSLDDQLAGDVELATKAPARGGKKAITGTSPSGTNNKFSTASLPSSTLKTANNDRTRGAFL